MIRFHHNPICRAVADPGSRHHGHRTEALKLHKFVPLLPPVLGGEQVKVSRVAYFLSAVRHSDTDICPGEGTLASGQLCSTPEVRQTSSCSDILANMDYWTVSIDVLLSFL